MTRQVPGKSILGNPQRSEFEKAQGWILDGLVQSPRMWIRGLSCPELKKLSLLVNQELHIRSLDPNMAR